MALDDTGHLDRPSDNAMFRCIPLSTQCKGVSRNATEQDVIRRPDVATVARRVPG